VRQYENTACFSNGERRSSGTSSAARTRAGSGSATGDGAVVYDRRIRPRLLFWLSSLFQPPWFCFR
jgi:hypothetical protein